MLGNCRCNETNTGLSALTSSKTRCFHFHSNIPAPDMGVVEAARGRKGPSASCTSTEP